MNLALVYPAILSCCRPVYLGGSLPPSIPLRNYLSIPKGASRCPLTLSGRLSPDDMPFADTGKVTFEVLLPLVHSVLLSYAPIGSKIFLSASLTPVTTTTPPQDPPRMSLTSHHPLGLLTGVSQVMRVGSIIGSILSTNRAATLRPPHGGAYEHHAVIRHHPRTRRVRTVLAELPKMAVVRLAAKNVLLEKAPKYLVSMSFVLVHFVQALILVIFLVPHSMTTTRVIMIIVLLPCPT